MIALKRIGFIKRPMHKQTLQFIRFNVNYIDNFENFPTTRYQELIDLWERKFNEIDALIKDGVEVVFPKEGFGSLSMPSELFVYLSNKLVSYGLLNPGSVQYQDVQETLGKVQGITDAEIIEKLYPFLDNPIT